MGAAERLRAGQRAFCKEQGQREARIHLHVSCLDLQKHERRWHVPMMVRNYGTYSLVEASGPRVAAGATTKEPSGENARRRKNVLVLSS